MDALSLVARVADQSRRIAFNVALIAALTGVAGCGDSSAKNEAAPGTPSYRQVPMPSPGASIPLPVWPDDATPQRVEEYVYTALAFISIDDPLVTRQFRLITGAGDPCGFPSYPWPAARCNEDYALAAGYQALVEQATRSQPRGIFAFAAILVGVDAVAEHVEPESSTVRELLFCVQGMRAKSLLIRRGVDQERIDRIRQYVMELGQYFSIGAAATRYSKGFDRDPSVPVAC